MKVWHQLCSITTIKHAHYSSFGTKPQERPVDCVQVKSHLIGKSRAGFALAEVTIALAVLVFTVVAGTQGLLQSNRNAAAARVMNAAKAEALSRIQQVTQCAFAPDAAPPVVPAILAIGTATQAVDLGSEATDLGKIPGTVTWTVASVTGTPGLRSIRCTVNYTYLRKNLSYELFTYKSAD